MSHKKPFDQAFKYLAEQDAESLLILLGCIRPNERVRIEPVRLELSVSTILPDQAYLVTNRRGRRILHPEAQTQWKKNLLTRIPDYQARFWMAYHLPVHTYVLLLTPDGLPKNLPDCGLVQAGDLEIRANFTLEKVYEMSAPEIIALNRVNLLPFVPLMENSREVLEVSVRRLREIKDEQKRRDLGLHFLTLGGLRYNREDLLDLIVERGMIPFKEFRRSSFYQMILDEGREEGRTEGETKGEIKGAAKTLLLLIKSRFPKLRVNQQIKRIQDAKTLENLSVELLKMKDGETLKRRLAEILKSGNH